MTNSSAHSLIHSESDIFNEIELEKVIHLRIRKIDNLCLSVYNPSLNANTVKLRKETSEVLIQILTN